MAFKIGVCISMNPRGEDKTGIESLGLYKKAGCDYVEVPMVQTMELTRPARAEILKAVADSGLSCLTCNNFLPAALKVTGPAVKEDKVRNYMKSALDTAAALDAKFIVFGSSGARNFPAGFPKQDAEKQFAAALAMAGDLAEPYKIDFVIEHLNRFESNIVNSFSEALALAKELNHPRVWNLVDLYHFSLGNEDYKVIAGAKGRIKHAHIANLLGRAVPLDEREWDYAGFFAALKKSGYTGGVSIEGYSSRLAADFRMSIAMLKKLAE